MSKQISPKAKTVTIKLQYPFEWQGEHGKEEISEVEFSRPKGKHLKGITKDVGMAEMFNIAAKISVNEYITPSFFDEMDAADCMTVIEVIGDFLDGGQKTGETA